MTTTRPATAVRSGKARTVVLWTVQGVLAAFFAFVSIPKLTGDPTTVEMMTQFGFIQWVGYLIGAAELGGAIGLLIPRLMGTAAIGLAALMVGATVTNLTVMGAGAAATTAVLAAVFFAIAWARRDSVRTLLSR